MSRTLLRFAVIPMATHHTAPFARRATCKRNKHKMGACCFDSQDSHQHPGIILKAQAIPGLTTTAVAVFSSTSGTLMASGAKSLAWTRVSVNPRAASRRQVRERGELPNETGQE